MSAHDVRFPNESPEYRTARNALLEREIKLRQELSEIAAQRRELPPGGALAEDYSFTERAADGANAEVKLSELFGDKDSLVIYSLMCSPGMENACPACTSIIDSFDGNMQHLLQRLAFAVVGKSPIERLSGFADGRSWQAIRLLSSAGNSYNADYHAETPDGAQLPAVNVFARDDAGVRHFYSTELLYAKLDGHPRHADQLWPIWNVFDLTPEGRGQDWFPSLSY